MKSSLLIFSSVVCAFDVIIQHIFAKSDMVKLLFHVSLRVLALMFRSLMHFGVILCIWYKMRVQLHTFFFFLKSVFFFIFIFNLFIYNCVGS